ncbi:MAG TPA: flotillin domain-containing protein [Burkholderiaceae bacterium]|nr:flotillin domain-containing protein [Burkholderiaceae bacterium]
MDAAEESRAIELAAKRAERIVADRSVKEAEIEAQQFVESAEVTRERAVESAKIERRRATDALEIARTQAAQAAEIRSREELEQARIAAERVLDEARVGRERHLRELEIAREREVELAFIDKAVAVHQKSLEESAAKVHADGARLQAAEAAERVTTARESEVAKRRRAIEVLLAEKQAEEVRIAAEAERVRAAVQAEAQRMLNEAENVLTDEARHSLFRRKLLDRVEGIVRESVRPMEKIEGIKILHVNGLNGHGGEAVRNPTDEVIDSALRYRVQAPLVDSILADIGIEGGSLAKMPGLIREARDMQGLREAAQRGAGKSGPRSDPASQDGAGRGAPSGEAKGD